MKIDLYVKFLLSVIALCLVLIVVKDYALYPEVHAEAGTRPVPKTAWVQLPVNTDGTIDVNLKSSNIVLDVNLEEIDGRSLYGVELPVDIRRIDGSSIYGGAIPVQTK